MESVRCQSCGRFLGSVVRGKAEFVCHRKTYVAERDPDGNLSIVVISRQA